jgi:hypothetical protein
VHDGDRSAFGPGKPLSHFERQLGVGTATRRHEDASRRSRGTRADKDSVGHRGRKQLSVWLSAKNVGRTFGLFRQWNEHHSSAFARDLEDTRG